MKNKLPLRSPISKPITWVKIFSANNLIFFSQILIKIWLLLSSGHPSISMPILFCSCTVKYHWDYIPTIWYFKEKQYFRISGELHATLKYFLDSICTERYSIGKLNHISVIFLQALFFKIKISHYHGRKPPQTTAHEMKVKQDTFDRNTWRS